MGRAARAFARVESGVFDPDGLPEGGVIVIALVPALVAGLAFFRLYAAEALTIAAGAGLVFQIGAWRLRLGAGLAPTVAPVVAVALIGPAAPQTWLAVAAALAGALEIARRRWLPTARFQAGLVAAAAVFLASLGATAGYLNPGGLRPLAEPIRLWQASGAGAAAPIDPVRLYVGNVPGPMFATSLLAVAIGAAWLWYARRLSLAVLVAFLAGAALPIALWRWSPGYQLESGPAWFVVALVLADRANLPNSRAARPLLGLAAGVAGVGLRAQGLGIEALLLSVAALQLTVAALSAVDWLIVHRGRVRDGVAGLRGGVEQLQSPGTAA